MIETAAARSAAARQATAAIPATAPSIVDLGRHLATVERAYAAQDEASCNQGNRDDALKILDERRDALRDLIATLPAQTMQDVAVQIEVAATIASILTESVVEDPEADRMDGQIERMLLGMLPVASKAAGLDLDAMFWTDMDALRVARFAGVGVAS